ncbi:MAG: hypothetical protein ABI675_03065 [Chitinophagaceae bacterium]
MILVHQLSAFYRKVESDKRIGGTHISLYMAMFLMWCIANCESPLAITRQQLMPLARISGLGTYHKCMKDLVAYGYIKYQPSPRPYSKSLVWLVILYDKD